MDSIMANSRFKHPMHAVKAVAAAGLLVLITGCWESEQTVKTEAETGPNTLQVQQAMQREQLAFERERLAMQAGLQKQRIEAQKERDAERLRNCWLSQGGRRQTCR
jgi:hypothetical protein